MTARICDSRMYDWSMYRDPDERCQTSTLPGNPPESDGPFVFHRTSDVNSQVRRLNLGSNKSILSRLLDLERGPSKSETSLFSEVWNAVLMHDLVAVFSHSTCSQLQLSGAPPP